MANNALIPNIQEPNHPFTIVNLSNILKLTPMNYVAWQQVTSTLFGYGLKGFIDGNSVCPLLKFLLTLLLRPILHTPPGCVKIN